jgi:hypothetical protein
MVNPLLHRFGLCLPDDFQRKNDVTLSLDFDALSPLALPLQSTSTSDFHSVKDALGSVTGMIVKNSVVSACDPGALRVPSNAELRFRRLISTYRLQIDDASEDTISTGPLPVSTSPGNGEAREKGSTGNAEGSFDKTTPRWMLWSVMCACY